MDCIGGFLCPDAYNLAKPVGIIENKKMILDAHGLLKPDQMEVNGIDCRLLSVFCTSLSDEYEGFIVVYDYEKFCADPELMEAIIWHEIGHLINPVNLDSVDIDAEIACDKMAYDNAGVNGIVTLLNKTIELGKQLGNTLLIEISNKRLSAILNL